MRVLVITVIDNRLKVIKYTRNGGKVKEVKGRSYVKKMVRVVMFCNSSFSIDL